MNSEVGGHAKKTTMRHFRNNNGKILKIVYYPKRIDRIKVFRKEVGS